MRREDRSELTSGLPAVPPGATLGDRAQVQDVWRGPGNLASLFRGREGALKRIAAPGHDPSTAVRSMGLAGSTCGSGEATWW